MTFMEIRSLKWLLKSLNPIVFTFGLFFTTCHNLSHFSLEVKVLKFLDLIIDMICNTCHEDFPAVIKRKQFTSLIHDKQFFDKFRFWCRNYSRVESL